ncbi:UNVERIFIED_CONTAM: hypothetical protein PYX00_008168 [Menopon gallinae]|uniref:Chitin-binding type-2 domain-containing protein n=1 Tax=Menopon gallinae TaxID=328185 RepID=A0AAW2HN51_9NEOP
MKILIASLFAVGLSVAFALPAVNFSPVGKCPPTNGKYPVFLIDSENRSIYYECNHGVPIKMSCAKGLVFDLPLKTCVRETLFAAVGQCPPVDGEFATFLPDSEDDRIYYECRNGEPVRMKCPDGLVFNPNLNVCDWPKKTDKPVGQCPEVDPEVPVILPDSESCSIYYVCFAGEPFMATCPDGLYFNPERNYCDFPQNVNCPQNPAAEEQ